MNREIKFRAWHKTQKRYIEWDCIDLENSFLAILMKYSFTLKATIPFEDIILEQYTGLKDNYGKEIYEGDIVKVDESDVFSSVIGVFVFERSSFVIKTPYFMFFGKVPEEREMEIIGNIHENEDLLKGGRITSNKKGQKYTTKGIEEMEEKMRDAFGVKALEELGYRKHNEFEVKTTKAKTSIKTLEELGYRLVETDGLGRYADFVREENYNDYISLWFNGNVIYGSGNRVSQEIHKAIEHEMKKRGWWK